jgi:hypothetical protein
MSFEGRAFAGADDRSLIRGNHEKARITDEIELKSGELLEICRTSFNHLPSGVGQVVPGSSTRALGRVKVADIGGNIQRFSQGRRVSLGAQLVDELEDTSDIVVDLEDLHR